MQTKGNKTPCPDWRGLTPRYGVVRECFQPGKLADKAHIESLCGVFQDERLNPHRLSSVTEAEEKVEKRFRDLNESWRDSVLSHLIP